MGRLWNYSRDGNYDNFGNRGYNDTSMMNNSMGIKRISGLGMDGGAGGGYMGSSPNASPGVTSEGFGMGAADRTFNQGQGSYGGRTASSMNPVQIGQIQNLQSLLRPDMTLEQEVDELARSRFESRIGQAFNQGNPTRKSRLGVVPQVTIVAKDENFKAILAEREILAEKLREKERQIDQIKKKTTTSSVSNISPNSDQRDLEIRRLREECDNLKKQIGKKDIEKPNKIVNDLTLSEIPKSLVNFVNVQDGLYSSN